MLPQPRLSLADSLQQAFAPSAQQGAAPWPMGVSEADTLSPAQHYYTTSTAAVGAIDGEMPLYSLRNDDFVCVALFLSTFALLWLAVSSWGFVVRTATAFFYDLRLRRAVPTDGTDIEEVGDNRVLHLLVAFLGAMAYVCYVRAEHETAFMTTAPYGLLLKSMGLIVAWYIMRGLLHKFIDSVFFERWQHTLYVQQRTQCTFLMGYILLPLLLVEVFFAPPAVAYKVAFFFVIAVSRLTLALKCYSTFFTYRGGFIHLILYFCTLEIAPLAALWRLLATLM